MLGLMEQFPLPGAQVHVRLHMLDAELPPPQYAVDGDAGMDLRSRIDVALAPGGGRALVAAGFAVAIPRGWAGFVLPRSGLAIRHGVTLVNSPGLIDSGYRGEIMVPMLNTDPVDSFVIRRGDRIAQLLLIAVPHIVWDPVDHPDLLGGTERGTGGFGHSGR